MSKPKKPVPRAKAVECWIWKWPSGRYFTSADTQRALEAIASRPHMWGEGNAIPVRVRITEIVKKKRKAK